MPKPGRLIIITGAMAAGKSTVAQGLAERLPRSVHLRGDVFRRMIVNGGVPMASDAPTDRAEEALRQLRLRYDLAAQAAQTYCAAGFDVVLQDVVIGAELSGLLARLHVRRTHLIVLVPDVATLRTRENGRDKTGGGYDPTELDHALRNETVRVGYWLDSSAQTPEQTVEDILAHLDLAAVQQYSAG